MALFSRTSGGSYTISVRPSPLGRRFAHVDGGRAVNILHVNLKVPVTAKFRVFPTVEKTIEYARMLERAGAQILTCHGRVREQRGQNSVSRPPPERMLTC
jgi:hypothetical protein